MTKCCWIIETSQPWRCPLYSPASLVLQVKAGADLSLLVALSALVAKHLFKQSPALISNPSPYARPLQALQGQWRPTAVFNILYKLYWNEKPHLSSLRPSSSWLGADDRTSSGWSQPPKRRLFWAWRWEGQSGELRRTQRGPQATRERWLILRLRGERHGGVESIQGPQHGGFSSLAMSFLTGFLTSFKRHFLCQ